MGIGEGLGGWVRKGAQLVGSTVVKPLLKDSIDKTGKTIGKTAKLGAKGLWGGTKMVGRGLGTVLGLRNQGPRTLHVNMGENKEAQSEEQPQSQQKQQQEQERIDQEREMFREQAIANRGRNAIGLTQALDRSKTAKANLNDIVNERKAEEAKEQQQQQEQQQAQQKQQQEQQQAQQKQRVEMEQKLKDKYRHLFSKKDGSDSGGITSS